MDMSYEEMMRAAEASYADQAHAPSPHRLTRHEEMLRRLSGENKDLCSDAMLSVLRRMFTAEEFTAISEAATAHIFYHRTYCNHVNAWIARAGLGELEEISYGAELPADLAESMAAMIEAAGGGAT